MILRADFATRTAGYAQLRQNGLICANDFREREDMPFIPEDEGGNAFLVNGNMISMSAAQNAHPSNAAASQEGGDNNTGKKQ